MSLFCPVYFRAIHAIAGIPPVSYPRARYRKVMIWPLVQTLLGLKAVALVPPVIPFSTAHFTASA